MRFIDSTYFVGPLTIAQLGQPTVVSKLNDMIDQYQLELVQAALGYELAEKFLANIEDPAPEARFTDLKVGKVFTTSYGRQAKWVGFQGTKKKAEYNPLTAYVFWQHENDLMQQTTGMGVVQANSENATVVNPAQKMSKAWNIMVENIWVLWEFMNANADIYPEFNLWDVAGLRIYSLWPYYANDGCGKIVFRKSNVMGI